jgi:hypothetical protein
MCRTSLGLWAVCISDISRQKNLQACFVQEQDEQEMQEEEMQERVKQERVKQERVKQERVKQERVKQERVKQERVKQLQRFCDRMKCKTFSTQLAPCYISGTCRP